MQGNQFTRQGRITRATEASPHGLTMTDTANLLLDSQVLQPQCHAEAQRAPREICWILLPSLKVFSVPLPGSIENKVKKNPLQVFASWRLCMRRVFEWPRIRLPNWRVQDMKAREE